MDFVTRFRNRHRSDNAAFEWDEVLDEVFTDDRVAAQAMKAADRLTSAEAAAFWNELLTVGINLKPVRCDIVDEGQKFIKFANLLYMPVVGTVQDIADLASRPYLLDDIVETLPARRPFPYHEGCYLTRHSLDPSILLKMLRSSLGDYSIACDAVRNGTQPTFDDEPDLFAQVHQSRDVSMLSEEFKDFTVLRLMPFVQWHAVPPKNLRTVPDSTLFQTPDSYETWSHPLRQATRCTFMPPMPLMDAAAFGFAGLASYTLAGLRASGQVEPGAGLQLSNRRTNLAMLQTASGHPVAEVYVPMFHMAGPERVRHIEAALEARIVFDPKSAPVSERRQEPNRSPQFRR